MMNRLLSILLIVLVQGCIVHVSHDSPAQPLDNLGRLADYMTGVFSSEAQSRSNTDYFNIQLTMAQIWPERDDGYWLIVEQAVAGRDPYRQRVYHLSRLNDAVIQSTVYSIDNPENFIGAWQHPEILANLSPDMLRLLDGCEIILKSKDNLSFIGSTISRECVNDFQGARFMTSEVTITSTYMISWDRGFDDKGNQIWGAETGGYIFNKIQDLPIK